MPVESLPDAETDAKQSFSLPGDRQQRAQSHLPHIPKPAVELAHAKRPLPEDLDDCNGPESDIHWDKTREVFCV